jgi:regulator of RNase E activity RraB
MPRDPGDDLDPAERDWQQQIRVQNAELWAVCEQSGVTPDTLIRVRGRFGTWDDEDVVPMQRILETEYGYEVEVGREPDGSGGMPWVLTAVLPVGTWTLRAIDEWTDEMIRATAPVPGLVFMEWTAATVRPAPQVEQAKRGQYRTNLQVWQQLQQHGVTPGTLLTPDAHFWARTGAEAEELAVHLRDGLGYRVEVDVIKQGLLRRRHVWSVQGTTPPRTLNPDAIDAWTDEMVEVAAAHGAEFDGWGTEVPG